MSDSDDSGLSQAVALFQARASQYSLTPAQICDMMAILPLKHYDHDDIEQVMIAGHLRYEEALTALRLKDHIMQEEQREPRSIVERLYQTLDQMGNVSEEAEEKLNSNGDKKKKRRSRSLSPQEFVLPSKRRRPSDGVRRRSTKPSKNALKMSR